MEELLSVVAPHKPCEVKPMKFIKIFMFNYTYKHYLWYVIVSVSGII